MELINKLTINDKEYYCLATVVLNKIKYLVMQGGEIFYEENINSELKFLKVKNRKTLNMVLSWVKSGDEYGRIL